RARRAPTAADRAPAAGRATASRCASAVRRCPRPRALATARPHPTTTTCVRTGVECSMARMKKISLAAVLLMAAAGAAHAQEGDMGGGMGGGMTGGREGSIGVGAEFGVSGAGGISVNYDAGMFHAGGFLRLLDPAGDDNTDFVI